MRKNIGGFLGALFATCFVVGSASAADIAVVGGKVDDSFWTTIKKGIDDARLMVEANGGSVNYLQLQTYDNLGVDAAALVRTAIGQGVDGIVVPNWVPEAEDDAIKAAVAAGIKVMMMNAGDLAKAREVGALNYIGTDEYLAGIAAGEYFAQGGVKNIICVNTIPGAANLETRCKGVEDGAQRAGAKAKQLPLPASSFGDPVAVSEAVKATLLQDESLDGVITLGDADTDSAAIAIMQAGKQEAVKLGSFSFTNTAIDRIREGTQYFSVDQQPYLQSMLSVTLLAAHIDFGAELPVSPVLTGPLIIDASNVEAAVIGVQKGAR